MHSDYICITSAASTAFKFHTDESQVSLMHENNVYRESCHSVSTLLTPCLLEVTPWRYVPALELLPALAHFRHRSRPTWAQQSIILHTVLMLLGNPFLLFLAEGLALRSLIEWLTCWRILMSILMDTALPGQASQLFYTPQQPHSNNA